MSFHYVGLVPGLPHLLAPSNHPDSTALAAAMGRMGDEMHAAGIGRVLYFSTQWISVLGHMLQARPRLKGMHVDENWHDLQGVDNIPYDFVVDTTFAVSLEKAMTQADFSTKLVDYEGFPIDTGTIVADRLLNCGRFKTGMLSCCVYSNANETERLFKVVTQATRGDTVPTALIIVSGLSGRYFTTEIDPREDHISSPSDDTWNRRILDLLLRQQVTTLDDLQPEFASQCKADMGFKALSALKGAGVFTGDRTIRQLAYGAIYGAGAAVVAISRGN